MRYFLSFFLLLALSVSSPAQTRGTDTTGLSYAEQLELSPEQEAAVKKLVLEYKMEEIRKKAKLRKGFIDILTPIQRAKLIHYIRSQRRNEPRHFHK